MSKSRLWAFFIAFSLILGSYNPAWATEPVVLDLPPCDEVWLNGSGDHNNNCSEYGGLGGCNGIVGDVALLGDKYQSIPSGQIFCGDHRIQGCDKVTKVNCHTLHQFLCTTVPIFLIIDGVNTKVAPGVGIPTEWRVADSCSEAQPEPVEFCEVRGCDWNVMDSNPYDENGCPPAIAHHYPLCDCRPHFCGDGTQDQGEECDDGNNTDGDGCSSTCTEECGNGTKDAGEECDDGNLTNDDGCNSSCELECGPILNDPGIVKRKNNSLDLFKVHGRLPIVVNATLFRIRLMNNTDTAFDQTYNNVLQGHWWKDYAPPLYRFKMESGPKARFSLSSMQSEINNFSPDMCVRIDVDGQCFKHCPYWFPIFNGWRYSE